MSYNKSNEFEVKYKNNLLILIFFPSSFFFLSIFFSLYFPLNFPVTKHSISDYWHPLMNDQRCSYHYISDHPCPKNLSWIHCPFLKSSTMRPFRWSMGSSIPVLPNRIGQPKDQKTLQIICGSGNLNLSPFSWGHPKLQIGQNL